MLFVEIGRRFSHLTVSGSTLLGGQARPFGQPTCELGADLIV
jgi:hypothetical protein